jgi:hypothetical protein
VYSSPVSSAKHKAIYERKKALKIDDIPPEELTAALLASIQLEKDPYHVSIGIAARTLVAQGNGTAIYASSNNSQTFWIIDGKYISLDKTTTR